MHRQPCRRGDDREAQRRADRHGDHVLRQALAEAHAGVVALRDDFRRTLPRFQDDALRGNLALVGRLREVAAGHGVTVAQLALAWLLHQDGRIVPIPPPARSAISRRTWPRGVTLGAADLAAIDAIFGAGSVHGARYAEGDFDQPGTLSAALKRTIPGQFRVSCKSNAFICI